MLRIFNPKKKGTVTIEIFDYTPLSFSEQKSYIYILQAETMDDSESASLLNNVPLIQTDNKNKWSWKNLKKFIIKNKLHVYLPIGLISIIIFSFITIFLVHVEPNIGVGVSEGTHFETDNVSFVGIGDAGGIDLKVSGTNLNNFTNIEDFWIRNYFKNGGFCIRQLNLKINELDLIVSDSSTNEDMNLGKVEIQPFLVSIADNKSTDMDLFLTLWPNSKGVRRILKKILLDSDSKLRLRGDAAVRVYILNGYLPVSSISIPLDIEFM